MFLERLKLSKVISFFKPEKCVKATEKNDVSENGLSPSVLKNFLICFFIFLCPCLCGFLFLC